MPEIINECCANNEKPEVVVIGHSFGARLFSRALFSKNNIKNLAQSKSFVDVFIALQGAFSVNRFIENNGKEGWPYAEFNQLNTDIVLTSSEKDFANGAAFFKRTPLIGGKYGLEIAKETANSNIFYTVQWSSKKNSLISELSISNNKVIVIDATSIVDDHNDILDDEMGELIWSILDQ